MRKLFWIVLIIVLAVVVYMVVKPETGVAPTGEMVTAEGEVLSVNTEGVALDGPALVTLSTADGERVVAVPSMGINLCAAKEDIADVYEIVAGETVSARGSVDEEGRIVPCVDESHYLRVTQSE